MKTFKEHMSEETNPFALSNGFVGVEDEKARDNINALLNGITMKPFLTPYIALERVAKVLANYHIHLPKHTFDDAESDSVSFEVNQFGEKSGVTNNGEVVTKNASPYYIYFEYNQNEQGSYDVFCEIVDEDDLEELSSGEEELDESVQIQEVGDTEKGRERLEKYAAKAHSQTGYKSKLTPKEKKRSEYSDKALAIVDKKSGKKTIRSSSPLYDYDEEVKLNETSREKAKAYIKAAKKARDDVSSEMGDNRQRMYMPGYDSDRVEKQQKSLKRDFANRSSGIERAKKILAKEEHLDEKLSPEQKIKIRRRLGPNTPENRQRQTSDSAREEIRLAKRGGKDKDLNEATEKRKELLKRYIKAASHDVAARSAAVRGFARDADDQRKSGQAMDARRSDARADKMFKKSWNRRQYMAKAVDKLTTEAQSADTHTGALTMNGKPVMSPTATTAQPTFPPKKVPVPTPRPKNLEEALPLKYFARPLPKDTASGKFDDVVKNAMKNAKDKQQRAKTKAVTKEELSPADKGRIAAGYRGSISNPAKQGAIAAYLDDQERERKANFKVAKKLAKEAKKTAMKKAMEKKSSK